MNNIYFAKRMAQGQTGCHLRPSFTDQLRHHSVYLYFPSGISITRPPMMSSILKSFLGLYGWVL